MKNPSKKSVYQQQRPVKAVVVAEVSSAVRNPVYSKTESRRPAAMRNPRQRVKHC